MLCSAQGHNTATRVDLEPPISGSGVQGVNHLATAPPRRYGSTQMTIWFSRSGPAKWLAPRTTDQGVPGSRPGRCTVCCGLEKVTFTHCLVLVKPRKPWTDDWHGLTVTRLETTLCLMCLVQGSPDLTIWNKLYYHHQLFKSKGFGFQNQRFGLQSRSFKMRFSIIFFVF